MLESKIDERERNPDDSEKESNYPATFQDSGYGSKDFASDRSHTSMVSTATDGASGRPRVPSAPEGVFEGMTPCPYCGRRLFNITSRVAWKFVVPIHSRYPADV